MDIALLRRRFVTHGLRLLAGDGRAPSIDWPLRQSGILRILVCRTSQSLGNTLLITPLLQEIEAIWPGAEIDIVTRNPASTQIFAGYASVRDVYCLPRRAASAPIELARQLHKLRRNRYDLAIDSDPRSRTSRALLALSRARFKLGFVGAGKNAGLTHAIDIAGAPPHAGQIPVYLLRQALHRSAIDYPSLDLRLTAAEREQGSAILARLVAQSAASAKRGTIGVFANATGHKRRDAEWWRAFLPAIESAYPDFNFIEIAPGDGVSLLDGRYPAYYSSSVRKLARVLSGLSMVISLDCGIMHLARASGTKTAAVFTVTDSAQWGPYGAGAFVIDAHDQSPERAARGLVDAAVPELLFSAT
ncbi:MAG: glycosyltransferase family 9 protein [Rudaea sp.]